MARRVRLEYPGAVYHAMCRGDRREDIFLDEKDRWLFLDALAQACGRAGISRHLAMGHVSNVSRACRAVQDATPPDIRHRLCQEVMLRCTD